MEITLDFVKENTTSEETNFILEAELIGLNDIDFVLYIIRFGKYDLADRFIRLLLSELDCLKYKVYAAEQLIKDCPNEQVRKTIENAKNLIEKDEKNPPMFIGTYASFIAVKFAYDKAYEVNYYSNVGVDAHTKNLNQRKIMFETVNYGFKLLAEANGYIFDELEKCSDAGNETDISYKPANQIKKFDFRKIK